MANSKDEGTKRLDRALTATLTEDGDELTAAEQAALEGSTTTSTHVAAEDEEEEPGPKVAEDDTGPAPGMPEYGFAQMVAGNDPPEWAKIPKGFKLPKGKFIYYLRFPAEWTDKPGEGERQCIMWNLTIEDEDMALKRARGDDMRANRELSMAMVRAVDGYVADFSNGKRNPGDMLRWFNAIGGKCRLLVQNVYTRTHNVDEEMKRRFFTDCFVFTTST